MEKLKANSEGAGSYGIEETSPDALKNTPSNIARLEDVIEQCKGRQKYLAHTGSPSDGGDVRWYFCKVPLAENELAASVPHTEIVGKGDYFRFGMRDSLALEASFLQKEEELLSSWWKEYAECSEGPSSRLISSNVNMDRQMESVSYDDSHSTQVLIVEEERVGVPVKGGLYEVDLIKRHCFPVYWNGENRRVLRGHWFARKDGLDWLPLREDVAEQLEFAYRCQVWHRRTFQPSGLFAARIDLQGSTMGLHALFTGEDDTWEAWLNVDAYGFSNIMSLKGNGIKLRRGYAPSGLSKPSQDELRQQKEEEMDDYCSQVPVRHLVFMVHGIGQRLEKANLVDDVGNFRQITASLAELHLTSYQRDTQRVLFIPCQWRRGLKLGGESAVEKITLDGVKGLRIMLSATAHDVLYYMSPIYCQEIINSVSNQLNRLYMKFIKRNPDYDGKVSIYGHSLGSVLSYDILCHQDNLVSPLPLEFMYEDHVKSEESELDGITQLSERTSPSSVEDECSNSCTPNIEGSLGFMEEDKLHFQSNSTLQEKKLEDSLTALDCSAALDARNDFLKPCNQDVQASNEEATSPHESSLTEDSQKGDSCDMVPLEKNELDSTTIISSGVPSSKSDEGGENKYKDLSNKDRLIKLLTEEVKALKDRVAELESLREDSNGGSQQGSKKVDLNSLKQQSSQYAINQDGRQKSYTPYINYTKLEFKVDTFFAVGSPLGVFLALRNIRIGIGKGQDYWNDESISEEIPACRQMFNIFHPFDPVAYRVEPLICKEYLNKRPVIIPYHKGGKRLHIGFQEFTEDIATHSKAVVNQLHHMRVKVLTACQSRQSDNDELEDDQEKEEKSYGLIMMERLTGSEDGRIDHMLQDKTFEHPYISAIGAHTNYWRDHDTALFILKHLYRDIPEEPDSPSSSSGSDQKDVKTRTTVRFYQKDTIDEEFPLTFSDDIRIKEFSSKMRKALKKNR